MIPGRSIVTTLPSGVVRRAPCGEAGPCADCANDCPASGHDGRTCTGGCKVCTCGGRE
ncbi:MAG: hypothetical protein WC277_04885 [Bacilli bacterium]